MRVVVLVSEDASDLYFANQLARQLPVAGVLVESQRVPRDTQPRWQKALRLGADPRRLARRMLDAASEPLLRAWSGYGQPGQIAEFGADGERLALPAGCATLRTEGACHINDPRYVEWVRACDPEVIAVCGTSLLNDDLIATARHGVLNLHGGLSQRYRGLFTTDWAVHNREPEYVGATVHYVASGIDDGDVVYQGRTEIVAGDHPNSLYTKVVQLGVRMMVQAIRDLEAGCGRRTRLPQLGQLYRRRDFTPLARARTWRRIREGVIENYLAHQAVRDAEVKAIIINEYPTG